ncbi:hypothetical protein BDW59DRAFT_162367 [Aspergillus cavernicola]|uniref:Uncharacterized protein n=1 Tax=Aspergillus cavernicola TaxID=176166 RepID=A0ABR4I9Q0_9EURO
MQAVFSSADASAIQSPVTHVNPPVSPSLLSSSSTISIATSAAISTIVDSTSTSTSAISVTKITKDVSTDASLILNESDTTIVPPTSATETSEAIDTTSLMSSQPIPISPVGSITGNTPSSSNTVVVDDPTPTGSPVPPIPVPTTIVSSISTEFLNILPILSSWESNPSPPPQTDVIGRVDSLKDKVEDLVSEIGGDISTSGCKPLKKRGLIDDVFGVAGGAVEDVVRGGRQGSCEYFGFPAEQSPSGGQQRPLQHLGLDVLHDQQLIPRVVFNNNNNIIIIIIIIIIIMMYL